MNRIVNSLRQPVPLVCLVLGLTALLTARQAPTTIDYPGATSTNALKINQSGEVVGFYRDSSNKAHGFVWSQGRFTNIEYPGAVHTNSVGINDAGDVVGEYYDAAGVGRGFLLSRGKFTSLEFPGAAFTGARAISNSGEIIGHMNMAGKPMQGFRLKAGSWETVDYRPGAPSNAMSCIFGVNDAGDAVGHWGTNRGSRHGILVRGQTLVQLDFGGGGFTDAQGINAQGDVVGSFGDAAGVAHGFVMRRGSFRQFDFPGATNTWANGINDSGDVTGNYRDQAGSTHGYVMTIEPLDQPKVLLVDDDGADCPQSVKTIQEAVQSAPGGSTILVCAGTYRNSVQVQGHEKDGLKLIAVGGPDSVVLQGDYTERTGIHLEDVNGVLVQGFTIRDFGAQATTDKVWGDGANIYMKNSHYNTIRNNRMYNGDMVGVWFQDAGNNVVENNQVLVTTAALANCGMHLGGAGSANNYIRQNTAIGNKMAGIMLAGAGTGNVLLENVLTNNGRAGIQNGATSGTWIEGNRISYNRGPWGTSPYPPEVVGIGNGISITDSTALTIFDNRARNNTGLDISWDGKGDIKFEANACNKANPAGACAH